MSYKTSTKIIVTVTLLWLCYTTYLFYMEEDFANLLLMLGLVVALLSYRVWNERWPSLVTQTLQAIKEFFVKLIEKLVGGMLAFGLRKLVVIGFISLLVANANHSINHYITIDKPQKQLSTLIDQSQNKWPEIVAKQDYKQLPIDEKVKTGKYYFGKQVLPKLEMADREPAWNQFYKEALIPTLWPKETIHAMKDNLADQLDLLKGTPQFIDMSYEAKQDYLNYIIIPYYEPVYSTFKSNDQQRYLDSIIFPALALQDEHNAMTDFISQTSNSFIHNGTFGLIKRPKVTNEWSVFSANFTLVFLMLLVATKPMQRIIKKFLI